jgi:hypothetical protein
MVASQVLWVDVGWPDPWLVAARRHGQGCGTTKHSSGFLDKTGHGSQQASIESYFEI